MNSFMESLKQIDWVQNVIYFFVFLALVLILFFGLVRPAIMEFKSDNIAYRKNEYRYEQARQELDEKKKQFKQFQQENRNMLNAFQNRFRNDSFATLSGKYFQSFQILGVRSESNSTQGFAVDEVNITTVLNSPSDLYEYMLFLNDKTDHIAQMSFPIGFQATRQGIKSNFIVKIYNNPPK